MNPSLEQSIQEAIAQHCQMIERALDKGLAKAIARAVDAMADALNKGGRIYICGNGGSAADAQHIAGELVGRFKLNRPPIPAVALTTDSSVITAIGNDMGYDQVFVRQVEALVGPGDVLIAISTSGASPNVLEAARQARQIGATVIGLTGPDVSPVERACDICISTGPGACARIQEVHQLAYHIICELLELRVLPQEGYMDAQQGGIS